MTADTAWFLISMAASRGLRLLVRHWLRQFVLAPAIIVGGPIAIASAAAALCVLARLAVESLR